MPITVTVDDVAAMLGGTHAGGNLTVYGVVIPDATVEARGIDPAVIIYTRLLGDSLIAAYPTEANTLATMRASRSMLAHIRQSILGGGLAQSYSIGKLSVTRPGILESVVQSLDALAADEAAILAVIQPGAVIDSQTDLIIVDPGIKNTAGQSVIGLDATGYGSGSPRA